MTPYEIAVKRIRDAGGTWPPQQPMARVTRWEGSGRYARRRCAECGRPMNAACSLCGEALHAGH